MKKLKEQENKSNDIALHVQFGSTKTATAGITLVALVVTIVVLLILSGITISALFGDNGIIAAAKRAAEQTEETIKTTENDLKNLADDLGKVLNNKEIPEMPKQYTVTYNSNGGSGEMNSSTGSTVTIVSNTFIAPSWKKFKEWNTSSDGTGTKYNDGATVSEDLTLYAIWEEEKITTTNVAEKLYGEDGLAKETKTVYDANENKITIPKGFKIVPNGTNNVVYKSGTPHVTDGIVVADKDGNEFVWIGVGNIKDTTGTEHEIKLARREFSAFNKFTLQMDGDGHVVQTIEDGSALREAGTNYDFLEEEKTSTTYANKKFESISTFLTSAREKYNGYYIARYEASYKDANTPYSKPSTSTRSSSSTALKSKMLWNFITQSNAAKVSKNMYNNDSYKGYVTSDLINSYAWDTALYFIQQFSGQSAYSKQTTRNTSLGNTGERSRTTDKVCNIYDMASNTMEWSTETSTVSSSPCVYRGGTCGQGGNPASLRDYQSTSYSYASVSFRPALYVNL